jgi:hypothetical protein
MKKLVLIVVGVLAIAGVFVFKAISKGPVDVAKAKAQQVTAPVLYNEYLTDSSRSANKFTAKVLLVEGVVNEIVPASANRQALVKLKTSVAGAFINCSMEFTNATISKGDAIKIKGICSGLGEGDADLGIPGDVYLSRCMVAE